MHNHYYGTPRQPFEKHLAEGRSVLLDIDVQGGESIKRIYPDAVSIFIIPPSLKELEKRLMQRKTDTTLSIQQRLKNEIQEMGYTDRYDYIVVNDELERAFNELSSIVIAEGLRGKRMKGKIKEILGDVSEEEQS